ncbi:hypothetical protein [Yinghuangia sp. YIM S09857]|uniref:hypothetical protein n=1 Tax=Yinghuangia sp. YIM S09857 TaxID=3436929 RepID=UPI003F532B98
MLRRLMPRRSLAATATGALTVVGLVVLAAPAAEAAPIEYMSQCVNQTLPQLPIDPSLTKIEISVEPAKPTYAVGETVTVHWKWLAYSNVPLNTPVVTEIAADSTLPKGQLTLSGAQTTELDVQGERKNAATKLGDPLIITDMKGSVTLTGAGTVDFTPKQYSTWTMAFGLDSETRCLPVSPPAPIGATITVEPGQVDLPEVEAPGGEVRPGAQIALAGSKFTPNATPQVSLCQADGKDCQLTRFSSNTLVIDNEGKLSGNATLAATGIADGQWVVRVTDGAKEARDTLTVKAFVPGERTLVAEPSSGPVGTTVKLTGTNWTPNVNVNVAGLDASGSITDNVLTARTSPDGNFTLDYPIGNGTVTQIRAREGISSTKRVIIPFTVTTGPLPMGQHVDVTLAPGDLSFSQAGDGINFGSATLNGEVQTLQANLNQVTVLDARGGMLGWSLTGTMTDLVAANGTDKIPAGNVAWTPSCAATQGSLSEVANGTPSALGSSPAALCSQAPANTTTGGEFTADAQMTLTTPQFAAAGTYTGTLTLTLI